MLEEKKLREAEKRVKQYLNDGVIRTKGKPEHVDFFPKNADDSLDSAKALFELSTDPEKQKFLGFTSFNGLLWVVNASYYSMFYMARALLESEGIKIKTDLSVHAVTFDAVVSCFYLTGKLEKALLDDFIEAQENVTELLGKQKADELIETYPYEEEEINNYTISIHKENGCRKTMRQKGQITLFIIIGMILLLGIGFFFLMTSVKEEPSRLEGTAEAAVQSYVQSCIDDVAKEAVLFVSKHGGYYDIPVLADTDLLIPYYFYDEQNIMVSKQELEEQLVSYMDNELFFCLKNFESFEGTEVTQGPVQTTATIWVGSVQFGIFFPVTITTGDATTTVTDFSTRVEARLNTIYDIMQEFMTIQEQDTDSICVSCLVALGIENNVRTEMYSIKDSIVQFSIIDEEVLINNEQVVYNFLNVYSQYSCQNLPPDASEEYIFRCVEQKIEAYNYTVAINNIPDMESKVGSLFTYDVNATGYNVTYTALTNLFTIGPETGVIMFIPTEDDVGEHTLWIHVQDTFGNEDYGVFVLRVTE